MKNLSFRMKLMVVLVSSIGGLLAIQAVGYNGIHQQRSTNAEVQQLTAVTANVSQLAFQALENRQWLQVLEEADLVAFQDAVDVELVTMEGMIADHQGDSERVVIADQVADYYQVYQAILAEMQDVARHRQVLGFSQNSGLRAAMDLAAEPLQAPVLFISLREPITTMREAAATAITEPSGDNQQRFDETFDAFFSGLRSTGLIVSYETAAEDYRLAVAAAVAGSAELSAREDALAAQLVQLSRQQSALTQELGGMISTARQAAERSSVQATASLLIVGFMLCAVVLTVISWIIFSVRNTLKNIIQDLSEV
ncbi:MAG: hypothetical protein WED11_09230, partial [Natronospirillum sp.]